MAWRFSNSGECVDLYAPGVRIDGASHTANDVFTTWSGTSMAVPHVAGAVAQLLTAWRNATASVPPTPADVKRAILAAASPGRVTATLTSVVLGRTPNRLLYVGPIVNGQGGHTPAAAAVPHLKDSPFVELALPTLSGR